MTISSKFRFEYIAFGVFKWLFLAFIVNIVAIHYYTGLSYIRYIVFTPDIIMLLIVTNIIFTVIFFVVFYRPIKFTVTDNEIVIKHLFAVSAKYIKYDQLAEFIRDYQIPESKSKKWFWILHRFFWRFPGMRAGYERTSIHSRTIRLKSGFSFTFDAGIYENFEQLDYYIQKYIKQRLGENWRPQMPVTAKSNSTKTKRQSVLPQNTTVKINKFQDKYRKNPVENVDNGTVVSKFNLSHILKGIGWLGFIYYVTYLVFHYIEIPGKWQTDQLTGRRYREYYLEFVDTAPELFALMILLCIVLTFIFYFVIWDGRQIAVTENNIILTDLLTRRKQEIKYSEISKVYRHFCFKKIKLKNGKTISLDNDIYKNFKEINRAIVMNFNKYKLQEQSLKK